MLPYHPALKLKLGEYVAASRISPDIQRLVCPRFVICPLKERDPEKGAPLTPALVLELHGVLTRGTLDDARDEGRLQTAQDERVVVQDNRDGIARQRGEQRGPFPPLHFGGRAGRFGKLGQFQPGAYTDGVAGEQLGLRPRAHPANGDDADHQPDLGHTPR